MTATLYAPFRCQTHFDHLVQQGQLLPLHEYDRIIVSFSGGKDSLAMTLQMLQWACEEKGYPKNRIELWHQDVDGGNKLMDWPCTRSYCRQVASHLGLPIRFQWKEGGFEGELLRQNERTKGVYFENELYQIQHLPPQQRKDGKDKKTRRKWPAKTANLQTRWCSAYLKIDVAKRALNNDPRFREGNFLFLTGERRQESAARSTYNEVETHPTTNRRRRTDQWRSIFDWDEREVWEIIERWCIVPHPAYRLGWNRVSCMACIFGNSDQWASVKQIAPETFERIAGYEREFGHTIDNHRSVMEMAESGESFVDAPQWLIELAMSEDYPADQVHTDAWKLPKGAFKRGGGPT